MDKRVKQTKKGKSAAGKKSKLNDVHPFIERPSGNRMNAGFNDKDSLAAGDLFSQFTANIIRQDTLFTR
jgi:hypothetical protein